MRQFLVINVALCFVLPDSSHSEFISNVYVSFICIVMFFILSSVRVCCTSFREH